MSRFPVSESKVHQLEAQMKRLGIKESDLEEHFVRSGGAGGQNVNKVSTCVVLKYAPENISIKCQQERSLAMNRFLARRLLVEKIDTLRLGRQSAKAQEIYQIKRQKKRRSRKSKQKMLEQKHRVSEKKQARKRVRPDFD